jgi:uncharacterized protein YxeA
MKKILAILVLALSLNAGLFSTMQNLNMDEIKTNAYTIDTAGYNPRIYEFTPKGDKSKLCIMAFGNSKNGSPTIFCFTKGK